MKINGNAIKPGHVIQHKGELWQAVKIAHTQPGKGGAYLQVELKGLKSGTKLNERFRASEDVEKVRLEQRPHQFLYENSGMYTFMDNENFEQIELSGEVIGEASRYLQDGMEVSIESFESSVLGVALPDTVILEVTETEPTLKGQTAAASYKPAVLENGVKTLVPPFVNNGDKVVISTSVVIDISNY